MLVTGYIAILYYHKVFVILESITPPMEYSLTGVYKNINPHVTLTVHVKYRLIDWCLISTLEIFTFLILNIFLGVKYKPLQFILKISAGVQLHLYKSDSSFPKNWPCQNLVVLLKCRQEKIKCGEKMIRRHMKREKMQRHGKSSFGHGPGDFYIAIN